MAGGVNPEPRPTSDSPKHLDDLMPSQDAYELADEISDSVRRWITKFPPGFTLSVTIRPTHPLIAEEFIYFQKSESV